MKSIALLKVKMASTLIFKVAMLQNFSWLSEYYPLSRIHILRKYD